MNRDEKLDLEVSLNKFFEFYMYLPPSPKMKVEVKEVDKKNEADKKNDKDKK